MNFDRLGLEIVIVKLKFKCWIWKKGKVKILKWIYIYQLDNFHVIFRKPSPKHMTFQTLVNIGKEKLFGVVILNK